MSFIQDLCDSIINPSILSEKLIAGLKSDDDEIRWATAVVLRTLDAQAITPEILNIFPTLLQDQNNEILIATLIALEEMHKNAATDEIINAVMHLSVHNKDYKIRNTAWSIISRWNRLNTMHLDTAERLLLYIKDKDEDASYKAWENFKDLRVYDMKWNSIFIKIIITILEHNDHTIRFEAAKEILENYDSEEDALIAITALFNLYMNSDRFMKGDILRLIYNMKNFPEIKHWEEYVLDGLMFYLYDYTHKINLDLLIDRILITPKIKDELIRIILEEDLDETIKYTRFMFALKLSIKDDGDFDPFSRIIMNLNNTDIKVRERALEVMLQIIESFIGFNEKNIDYSLKLLEALSPLLYDNNEIIRHRTRMFFSLLTLPDSIFVNDMPTINESWQWCFLMEVLMLRAKHGIWLEKSEIKNTLRQELTKRINDSDISISKVSLAVMKVIESGQFHSNNYHVFRESMIIVAIKDPNYRFRSFAWEFCKGLSLEGIQDFTPEMVQIIKDSKSDTEIRIRTLVYLTEICDSVNTETLKNLIEFVDQDKDLSKNINIFTSFSWTVILKTLENSKNPISILKVIFIKAMDQNSIVLFSPTTTEIIVLANNQRFSCKVDKDTFAKIEELWPKVMALYFNADYIKCLQGLHGPLNAPSPVANAPSMSGSPRPEYPEKSFDKKSECRIL